MKCLLLISALLGCTFADSVPAGPQGALLVLPQSFYASSNGPQQESLEKVSEKVMERLLQEQGSQRGNYHVYLPDGRLQRVQFTAAPVRPQAASKPEQFEGQQPSSASNSYSQYRQQQQSDSNSYSQYRQQQQSDSNSYSKVSYQGSSSQSEAGPNPVVAHFGRLQQEKVQQELAQLKQQQEELKQQEDKILQQLQQQKEFASNYVATIQFSDVPPIPAPIYSQSPAPLTRILRYAPAFY